MRPNPHMILPVVPAHLPLTEADALADLYRRGTPDNTQRAWERDLAYIAAWKRATYDAPLSWPEQEAVALRFVLDHAQDLGATMIPVAYVAA